MSHPNHVRGQLLRPDYINGIFLFMLSLILAACGGGGGGGGTVIGGGGIGGTGSVAAVGTVSAIGSVVVNGVTFNCTGAAVTTDDGTVDQGPGDRCVTANQAGILDPGMVVVVTGTSSGSVFTAQTVTAQNTVAGPAVSISATGQSFTVLSQSIVVDDATKYQINGSNITGAAGLVALAGLTNPIVQVSGFRNSSGQILATFVETKAIANGEFEVKGIAVDNGGTISIGSLTISLAGFSALTGCVKAKGSLNGSTLTLSRALTADNDCNGSAISGSLSQVEVEGIINNFVSAAQFNVGGQAVVTNSATIFEGGTSVDLLDGVKVEAEGSTTNGVLVAKKIQIKSNGVRIEGAADTALSDGSFTILGITVKVVTATENSLGTISAGTRMRIEGNKSGATQVTASKITNAGGGGGETRTELRGPLDANPSGSSFVILRVPVSTSGATFQDKNGTSISAATFFANTTINKIVKARGTESPDNQISASEVENED